MVNNVVGICEDFDLAYKLNIFYKLNRQNLAKFRRIIQFIRLIINNYDSNMG